jgi:metal-responsive CopG/Arc/MetJ family transcriptional regulator
MTQKWKTVQVPKELVDQVDEVIKSGKYGYASRAELIRDAIRAFLAEKGKSG